jgi:hypothetical protein
MSKKVARRSAIVQVGPNLRKRGAKANLVIGVILGTVVFFIVAYLSVYAHHIHH